MLHDLLGCSFYDTQASFEPISEKSLFSAEAYFRTPLPSQKNVEMKNSCKFF
jgi:hypothetical protein